MSKIDKNTSDNNGSESKQKQYTYLTSVQKYELEWLDLTIFAEDPSLERLRQTAIDGNLKISKFRSVCWALLFKSLSGDDSEWVKQRDVKRKRYESIKVKFNLNPHTIVNRNDNPLSQSDHSVWNQHFCDIELCSVIRQDVVRTFPGVDFYRKPDIQDIMQNILFCYARYNPQMCYRQGMHEILAPLLFVMHCDHQAFLHIQEVTSNSCESLKDVLNPKYLEADSFDLFVEIMDRIEPFYRNHDATPSSSGHFPMPTVELKTPTDGKRKSGLEVVERLNYIRDKILLKEDLHLHNHLSKLDIELQLFGMRWLRLLFGREFPLQDLLLLWDTIFAEGDEFDLANYIVVAMLVRIRDKLLLNDFTTCLTYLMKYPSNIDITLIIRHALHMKSPHIYPLPLGAFIYIGPNNQQSSNSASQVSNHLTKRLNNIVDHENAQKSGTTQQRIQHERARLRSYSTGQVLANKEIQMKVNGIQNTTALAAIRLARNNARYNDHEEGIVDGYLEDSHEILKIQLQNAFSIMSISRLKLLQYLEVLRRNIPGTSMHEIHQSMDGIEEICALLATKSKVSYNNIPIPVEPAFEVNELGQQKINRIQLTEPIDIQPINNPYQQPTRKKKHVTEMEGKNEFVRKIRSHSEFEVQAVEDDFDDYVHISINSSDSESDLSLPSISTRNRYEKPDNQLSRKAIKILGERKEVELREFMCNTHNCSHASIDRDYNVLPDINPSGERLTPS